MPPKIYIHDDTGAAYILQNDTVLYAPLNGRNTVLTLDDFSEVEYDLVGGEMVQHESRDITINDLGAIIRKILA